MQTVQTVQTVQSPTPATGPTGTPPVRAIRSTPPGTGPLAAARLAGSAATAACWLRALAGPGGDDPASVAAVVDALGTLRTELRSLRPLLDKEHAVRVRAATDVPARALAARHDLDLRIALLDGVADDPEARVLRAALVRTRRRSLLGVLDAGLAADLGALAAGRVPLRAGAPLGDPALPASVLLPPLLHRRLRKLVRDTDPCDAGAVHRRAAELRIVLALAVDAGLTGTPVPGTRSVGHTADGTGTATGGRTGTGTGTGAGTATDTGPGTGARTGPAIGTGAEGAPPRPSVLASVDREVADLQHRAAAVLLADAAAELAADLPPGPARDALAAVDRPDLRDPLTALGPLRDALPVDTDGPAKRAAGGVLLRPGPGGPQVLLVHRARHGDWSLPKGAVAPGESDVDAALREVREETGLRCRAGAEVTGVRYRDRNRRAKQVRYWLMTPLAASGRPDPSEVDGVRWVPLHEAARWLMRERDRAVVGGVAAEHSLTGHSLTGHSLTEHSLTEHTQIEHALTGPGRVA
ncbi:NUDIX hydrolase [Pseudonocardia parietis]|uniref:8-oxo-dGTP pyrophosphatase MutT (NUDIX family) n=1 Tax=Pseudonocardia parietis TaxID=570936 RepID=A0ABS4W319_9PSEU|nr:NUDIX hydrolase [Pseudonocardia parietis]MBP2370592.1 8-oxo-dGTP pyrophosphatase MutT (NUDIX family) [Pseudonocardia parietis]